MERAGLDYKTNWQAEMLRTIYSTPGIYAVTKINLEKSIKSVLTEAKTKEDLETMKQDINVKLGKQNKETINKVTEELKDPKKVIGSNIESINTLNRDNGTVITSVKTSSGSIYVKDSSYSGNMKEIVTEVANKNPALEDNELSNEAFREMQRRQIDIPMSDINTAKISDNSKKQLSKLPGDNKQINMEKQILVDERNRLIDLKNMHMEDKDDEAKYGGQARGIAMQPKSKAKVLTKKIAGIKINDAAFVDAMLLGGITLYAGLLGLCALFSKM